MDIYNIFQKISDIFTKNLNYLFINSLPDRIVNMRNVNEGVSLSYALSFRLLNQNISKRIEKNTSTLNYSCLSIHTHQGYGSKENNIPLSVYKHIYLEIIDLYRKLFTVNNMPFFVAIDGTNNIIDNKVSLNLGLYDITNEIPLDISFYGASNRNKEVSSMIDYITQNIDSFKNAIFVCDRFYCSYVLIDFLETHNLKYIIRAKFNFSLVTKKRVSKYNKNYTLYNKYNKLRKVLSKNVVSQTVNIGKGKKDIVPTNIKRNVSYLFLTNLDTKEYSNKSVIDY